LLVYLLLTLILPILLKNVRSAIISLDPTVLLGMNFAVSAVVSLIQQT
jgi:hypothetical protein